MPPVRTWRLPSALVAVLLYAPASAAGQTMDSTAFPLAEIVVSADRPVSEAAATVRTLGAEEITALGARTLDEALVLLPGLSIRRGGEGVPRVDVRGLRTRQVTLLLNGIPLNATDDGQFDPTLLPVEEIAEIKLTGGTGSVLYGHGGLGGTINVITRGGYGAPRVTARGEVRQGGGRLGRLTASGATGPLSVFASGSGASADRFPSWGSSPTLGPVAEEGRLNSDLARRNGFLQATLDLAHRATVGLTLHGVDLERGSPPSVIDDPDDPFAHRPVFDRVEDLDGLAAQLGGSFVPAPGWTTRVWLFRNLQHAVASRYPDERLDPDDVLTVAGTSRDRSRSLLTGGGAQIGLGFVPLGRLTLGLSAEGDLWQQSTLAAGGGGGSGGGGGGGGGSPPVVTVRSTDTDESVRRYGLALEYELRPAERVGLTLGGLQQWLDGGNLSDRAAGMSAGVTFEVTPTSRVRASAAHRFRFPTLGQLYDRSSGNPSLRTERADLFELGAEQQIGRSTTLGLTAFHTDARDFIERLEGGELFQNAERYRFRGIELVGTARPAPAALLRLGYSFLDADDRSPGREGVTLQYRPRHKITAEARWSAPWGMDAALSVHHLAGQVYHSRRAPLATGDLPDYTVVGIRLGQQLARVPLGFYGGIDNLLDEAYEQSYGFPQAGRVAYLGLDLRP